MRLHLIFAILDMLGWIVEAQPFHPSGAIIPLSATCVISSLGIMPINTFQVPDNRNSQISVLISPQTRRTWVLVADCGSLPSEGAKLVPM